MTTIHMAKVYHLIGQRPEKVPQGAFFDKPIPAGWLIFNAPRPLYGDYYWQGEFIHGIFYVAVNPADRYSERSIKENISLDGWQLQWHSTGEVMAWAQELALTEKIALEDCDWEAIAQSWHVRHNPQGE